MSSGPMSLFLFTKWVDYVEEPMKYQALRPQFFSVDGWGWWLKFDKKKLTAAGVLRKNIWFSLHIPKIKFYPSQQGKSALVFIF